MLLKISELKNTKILIFGLNGTGKTYLAKYLSRFFKSFVITLNPKEWIDEDVVIAECKTIDDYEFWLNQYRNKFCSKLDCVIIDDFDVFFQSHLQSLPVFSELMFRNRHIGKGITIIAITRRIQNIPTRYYEIFEHLVGFTIESTNVIQKLNEIYDGLGDMIKALPYKSYIFVWKTVGKEPFKAKV
jgi:hypothetical protein